MIRQGARQLIHQAVEAEVAALLAQYGTEVDEAGRQQIVRNGYLPERSVQTGVGAISVRVPCASRKCRQH
ncbi:putative transposase, mutator type [Magnetofaba australis IT-1]|uniref:Putative transposase, mutator type n=1 Tax=Magnetofaba australis IT-1 TaxID=1434232 RepID=A0A1Y2K795_9PROT|nr:putative transposase, mutator type [Magnetofaba australis IT-1]